MSQFSVETALLFQWLRANKHLAKRYVQGEQSFCASQDSFQDNARLHHKVAHPLFISVVIGIDVMNMFDPADNPLSCGTFKGR